jgi:hypothetical protein
VARRGERPHSRLECAYTRPPSLLHAFNRSLQPSLGGSVTFCPDPTPFFRDFKDAKQIKFSYFTHRHIIFKLKNLMFFSNFVLKYYFESIISVRSTLL